MRAGWVLPAAATALMDHWEATDLPVAAWDHWVAVDRTAVATGHTVHWAATGRRARWVVMAAVDRLAAATGHTARWVAMAAVDRLAAAMDHTAHWEAADHVAAWGPMVDLQVTKTVSRHQSCGARNIVHVRTGGVPGTSPLFVR
jgi:hypothetical protein